MSKRSRLVGKVGGDVGRAGPGSPAAVGVRPGGREAAPSSGTVIDGAVYPLEGQPPVARGGQWWPPKP